MKKGVRTKTIKREVIAEKAVLTVIYLNTLKGKKYL